MDARLSGRLSDDEKGDLDYQFRVVYTLQNTSKGRAHIRFVKPGSEEGLEIHNVLEKHVYADDHYPYKPGEVIDKVKQLSSVNFTSHNHTQAWNKYKVRPKGDSKQPENTNKDYCRYNKTYNGYTYSQKWIDFLVEKVADNEEFQAIKKFSLTNEKR